MATAAPTPPAGPSWIPTVDGLIKQAESLEGLLESVLNAAIPGSAAFDPEINAILGVVDSILTKIAGPAPTTPVAPPTP